jgi:hypothetical protein
MGIYSYNNIWIEQIMPQFETYRRYKGFGDELPIAGQTYTVTGRTPRESGSLLLDVKMVCYFATPVFPLSAWTERKVTLAPRAWLRCNEGRYWAWGAKSFAWQLWRDDWEHQLLIAKGLPEGNGAIRYSELLQARDRLQQKLWEIDRELEKAEIDDLR